MSDQDKKTKATGYDKYVSWKMVSLPVGLLILMLLIPTPKGMLDVGVEYAFGPKYVQDFFAKELFQTPTRDLSQWQVQMVRMMEESLQKSAFRHATFLKRSEKWCRENNIPSTKEHLEQVMAFAKGMAVEQFEDLLRRGYELRTEKLSLDELKETERPRAEKAGFQVKAAVGIVLFVVFCFVTEAIPLPMVPFCIGIIAMATGIVNRNTVASLYWSDATWFIMGSLMFAVAFSKTGVDKRIAMMMFGRLKNPDIRWVTLILFLVISPLTMFMSDHALAAMFLPIGITLYTLTTAASRDEDPELAKMLMITIAMAANLGGSLVPSGAARNIIMMSYTEDMFGIVIGFAQWCLYAVPFLAFMLPLTWVVINWRFKPQPAQPRPGHALRPR